MASKETEPSTLLNTKLKIKTEELFTKEIKPVEVFIREGKTEDFIREGKTEEDFIKESKTEDNIEYIAEEDTGNKAKKPVQTKVNIFLILIILYKYIFNPLYFAQLIFECKSAEY